MPVIWDSRPGNHSERDIDDDGLPGSELGGGVCTVQKQGLRGEGSREEQRVDRAQVGGKENAGRKAGRGETRDRDPGTRGTGVPGDREGRLVGLSPHK